MSCPGRRSSDLAALAGYIRPHWLRLVPVVILSLAGTLVSLWVPYISKILVDEALLGRNMATLFRAVTGFFLLTLISYALNVWSGLRYTRVSAEILFDMRLSLFRHLQRLSPRFWARTRLGEVISRINNDISEIQRVAAETALAWIGHVVFLAGSVVMMLWLDVRLFLVSLAALPIAVIALRRYRKQMESQAAGVRQASASIGSFLIESLTGMQLVVASNAQEREAARFRDGNDRFIDRLMAMQRTSYLAGGVPGLLLAGGSAAVFLYGGWSVIDNRITIGTLAAFLAYHLRLLNPVQAMMGLYANFATARVSLDRVRELFDEPVEVLEPERPVVIEEARGEIAFDNVSFYFDRGTPVLEDVSFTIAPGEVVAIIGPSGSGKSTIADLMLRMMDPSCGVIRLDGHDLKTLPLAGLRRFIAAVDQEPFLFHASIEENLRYAKPEATDKELGEAAAAAGISDWVASLPQAYQTVVGERGMAVSAGEKQRLALARAFLANPAVLVLDEPTSALDPENESRIMAACRQRLRGRTVIVITHRGELARNADRALVVDQTRVLAR
jgi:ATP-binding cassette subfamily B protein